MLLSTWRWDQKQKEISSEATAVGQAQEDRFEK